MSEGVEDAAADARMLEGISQRARQIEPLLKTTARHKDALKLVLADPPIATRNEDVKARAFSWVSAGFVPDCVQFLALVSLFPL